MSDVELERILTEVTDALTEVLPWNLFGDAEDIHEITSG
jgi:hypothetical protein